MPEIAKNILYVFPTDYQHTVYLDFRKNEVVSFKMKNQWSVDLNACPLFVSLYNNLYNNKHNHLMNLIA